MDDPQDFDVQQMEAKIAGIIERAYEGFATYAKIMARPGVTFSAEQRAQIGDLVEAGDLAGAQSIILDALEKALDIAPKVTK